MTNETTPPWDPQTTLTLLERARDLTIVFPAISFLLAVDVALSTRHGFNLSQLSWPLPPSIGLGGILTFLGCYLILMALILPFVVLLLDQLLYAVDDLLSRFGPSLLHATSRPNPRDYVSVYELDKRAKANKCEFTQRVVDAKLRALRADTQEIGKLAQAAGACVVLFVVDWCISGSSLAWLQTQCGQWGLPVMLCVLAALCLPWLGEMRALDNLSKAIYFPSRVQDPAPGPADEPAYRARVHPLGH